MNIESKLGLNVFHIDGEQAHIHIDQAICRTRCSTRYCLHVCPANLYTQNDAGDVVLDYEGCLECGTCLIACLEDALTWHYPRAGYGVQYRFG